MREILSKTREGSERHQLAFSMFCRRVKKYIGGYAALLGGVDAIVFTGGIGENCPDVRAASLSGLEFMGVVVDESHNRKNAAKISQGPVNVLVIPTNEELMIARSACVAIESTERSKVAVPAN
jgi:acetate kinase